MGVRIRAVLMDLGETLAHIPFEIKGWVEEVRLKESWETLTKFGVNVEFERFIKVFKEVRGKTAELCERNSVEIPINRVFHITLEKLRVDTKPLVLMELERAYYRAEVEAWLVLPDTFEALEKLSRLDVKMAVVSNSRSDWMVRKVISKLGLNSYFKVVTTSAELGVRKPRKEPFLRALEALKVKPEGCVMIGDTYETDILGAKNLGMKAIYIQRDPCSELKHFITPPDAVVTSAMQAVATLESWMRG